MKRSELRQIIKEEIENILEVNPDGTISPDEEEREEELIREIGDQLYELVTYAYEEAYKIGGEFRSPGIRSRIKDEFQSVINSKL